MEKTGERERRENRRRDRGESLEMMNSEEREREVMMESTNSEEGKRGN